MKLLLDSQALILAIDEPARLPAPAVAALSNKSNELRISAATVWELSIKVGLRKLTLQGAFRPWIERALLDLGAQLVPITVDYCAVQSSLPLHHRDPFDRMLAAQALVESLSIVSGDTVFDRYGVSRVWQ